MASYDCCRCQIDECARNTRNRITRIAKRNEFRIEIAFVEDRLPRFAVAVRIHTHTHTLNDLHSVITIMLRQLSYRCRYGCALHKAQRNTINMSQCTFKSNYTYLHYLHSNFSYSFHFRKATALPQQGDSDDRLCCAPSDGHFSL